MRFQSKTVRCEPCDDENVAYAFFSAEDSDRPHYIIISRNVDPVADGEIFVEIDDQGRMARNGVLKCVLSRQQVVLRVNEIAAAALKLGAERDVVIAIHLEADAMERLGKTFALLFKGSPAYENHIEA